DLPDRQVVGGAPVSVHPPELVWGKHRRRMLRLCCVHGVFRVHRPHLSAQTWPPLGFPSRPRIDSKPRAPSGGSVPHGKIERTSGGAAEGPRPSLAKPVRVLQASTLEAP